jgi:chromosome segregation ATPase
MAAILNGDSEHKSFAPLSHNQTLQICKHLQSLVTALDGKVDEFREDHKTLDAKVNRLTASVNETDSAMNNMKESMAEHRKSVDHLQNEFRQVNAGISYVHKGLDQTNDSVSSLRDGLKVTNTNATAFKTDLGELKTRIKVLEKQMANDSSGELFKLFEGQSVLKQAVQRLTEESAQTKSGMEGTKDFLMSTTRELSDTQQVLGRTEKAVLGLEEMLQQAQQDMKSTRTSLEETNAIVIKVHDDHESVKTTLKGYSKGLHDHNARFHKHQMELEKAAHGLERMRGDLSQTDAKLATNAQAVQNTANHVQSLREGFQMHAVSIADVTRGIEHVGGVAQQAKAQIQETNSLLLPNLQLEGDNPASQGYATTMSLASMGASTAAYERSIEDSIMTQGQSRASSRNKRSARTPKTMKTNAWLLRNIGTSPDRMAMI